MTTSRILLVDPDAAFQALLTNAARLMPGLEVVTEPDVENASGLLTRESFALVILSLDPREGGESSLDPLLTLKEVEFEAPVVVTAAQASVADAVESMKLGAADFLTKPVFPEILLSTVRKLLGGEPAPRRASLTTALLYKTPPTRSQHVVPEQRADDTPMLAPPDEPAPTLAEAIFRRLGTYRVVTLLGRGGMGAVYEGFDEALQRKVALKILLPGLAGSQESIHRFLREGRAIARISHGNVVQVYFAGTEDNVNFFAMEFVDGRNLQEEVAETGPLAPVTALRAISQAARGLRAAWASGIIHRDIKPPNLLRTREGEIKVSDFGLAKQAEGTDGMTQTGAVIGTPHFLSPEQGEGKTLDHRSDIYSLGATLYFLLSGEPPYQSDNPMQIILQHIQAPPPKLDGAPPMLNFILERMMAKDPAKRYADYDQLLAALGRAEGSPLLRNKPPLYARKKAAAKSALKSDITTGPKLSKSDFDVLKGIADILNL